MDEIDKLLTAYKLKGVLRATEVGVHSESTERRRESTADHVYSSMILAKYLLSYFDLNLSMAKIYDLLLFHDMIEVEVGDMFILDKDPVKRLEQKTAAKEILCEKLPAELAKDLELHWDELITPTLPESRFVKAIDELDPMITNIDDPEIWQRYGFTEEKLRSRKEAAFESFPELQAFFELVLERLKKNGCI